MKSVSSVYKSTPENDFAKSKQRQGKFDIFLAVFIQIYAVSQLCPTYILFILYFACGRTDFWTSRILFGIFNRSCLTDNINLNLSRIFKTFFNLLNNILRKKNCCFVINIFRFNHNSDFTACLNSK